jgi:hypothetical protein
MQAASSVSQSIAKVSTSNIPGWFKAEMPDGLIYECGHAAALAGGPHPRGLPKKGHGSSYTPATTAAFWFIVRFAANMLEETVQNCTKCASVISDCAIAIGALCGAR